MKSLYLCEKVLIQKRSLSEWLVLWILIFPFVFGFMREILHISSLVRLSLDLVLVLLFTFALLKKSFVVRKNVFPLFIVIFIFFLYTLLVYLFNFQSPFYYIWGFRNNFRFYVAFFSFVAYIYEDTARGLLKLLDFFFWINAAVSVIQFFFFDIIQDRLGGLFGSVGATNGYTLLFFAIIVSKALLATFNSMESPMVCVLKCAISLIVAAMAELKFYYFVFIFLLFFTALITRLSKRKIMIVIVAIFAVLGGSALLSYIFGATESFLTIEKLLDYATKDHYSSQGDLNRLSAIPTLMKNYVTEPLQQWFGLGLGNCDVSEVSIFNSTFHQQHYLLHYTWFTSAMLFLETGFVGLAFYISFFVICCVYSIRQLRNGQGNQLFCQMGIVVSVLCVILLFYNSSMRTEPAYIAYFVLSLPFLTRTPKKNSIENEGQNAMEE